MKAGEIPREPLIYANKLSEDSRPIYTTEKTEFRPIFFYRLHSLQFGLAHHKTGLKAPFLVLCLQ